MTLTSRSSLGTSICVLTDRGTPLSVVLPLEKRDGESRTRELTPGCPSSPFESDLTIIKTRRACIMPRGATGTFERRCNPEPSSERTDVWVLWSLRDRSSKRAIRMTLYLIVLLIAVPDDHQGRRRGLLAGPRTCRPKAFSGRPRWPAYGYQGEVQVR